MRLIDADAFDKILENGEIEAKKQRKYVLASALNTVRGNLAKQSSVSSSNCSEIPNNWISCSERLPEEAGEYICTLVGVHDSGIPSECGFEPSNQKGIIPGWSTCEADGFKFLRNDEVIAWMPMPEPYREG